MLPDPKHGPLKYFSRFLFKLRLIWSDESANKEQPGDNIEERLVFAFNARELVFPKNWLPF